MAGDRRDDLPIPGGNGGPSPSDPGPDAPQTPAAEGAPAGATYSSTAAAPSAARVTPAQDAASARSRLAAALPDVAPAPAASSSNRSASQLTGYSGPWTTAPAPAHASAAPVPTPVEPAPMPGPSRVVPPAAVPVPAPLPQAPPDATDAPAHSTSPHPPGPPAPAGLTAPTREQQLTAALYTLRRMSGDVEAAALVSLDGFIMASALPADMHPDRVGAMAAAILGLGERAAIELGRGRLSQVFIQGDTGYVLLMAAGDRAVLTVLARLDAKLGLLLYDMRDIAEAMAGILG